MRVPVLIFETDPASSELFDIALTHKGVAHVSYLVLLKKEVDPPLGESFRTILERHRPLLLITSWRHIGPAVKAMTKAMNEPRPIEKWVVSGYGPKSLEEAGVLSWADAIYQTPISPLDFAAEVERCLFRVRTGAIV